jgi:hypothetical protein
MQPLAVYSGKSRYFDPVMTQHISGKTASTVFAAWVLSLGFDFFLHGGLLARLLRHSDAHCDVAVAVPSAGSDGKFVMNVPPFRTLSECSSQHADSQTANYFIQRMLIWRTVVAIAAC